MIGEASAGWFKAQMAEVRAGLQSNGLDAILVPAERFSETFSAPISGPCFVVDGNHRAYLPMPLAKFSFMMDHPCWKPEYLEHGHPEIERLGWVDASHPAAAAAIGLKYRSSFCPHAGPDPTSAPAAMRERDIDVLFLGGLRESVDRARWRAEHPAAAPVLAELIFDTAEAVEASLEPLVPIFMRVCKEHGIDVAQAFSRPAFCAIVSDILAIMEGNRRTRVLAALPTGLRIAVATGTLPTELRDRRDILHLGYIEDFSEIRRLIGRAKIVLNVTGKFPQGSHERIWYAMAENAAVLTDQSRFMARDFADGETIRYLPLGAVMPEHLADLLALCADTARLQAQADAARDIYRAKHTWKERARLIIAAVGN